MLRLLVDENFPGDAIKALRSNGHDVSWVRTNSPGSSDPEVLAQAQSENRILVTFDKDFGELAFHAGLPAACGVILFRISTPSDDHVAQVATTVLETRTDWNGHFTVIEDQRIRITPLP